MANGSYGSLDIGTDKKTIKTYQERCVSHYDVEGDEYDDPINNPDHGYTQDGCGITIDGGAEIGDLIKVKAGHYRYRHIAGRGSCHGLAEFLEAFAIKHGNFRFAMCANESGMGFIETYTKLNDYDDANEGGIEYDDLREAHGLQRHEYEDEDGETTDEFWEKSDDLVEEYMTDYGRGISDEIGYNIYTLVPHKTPVFFRCKIKEILDQE